MEKQKHLGEQKNMHCKALDSKYFPLIQKYKTQIENIIDTKTEQSQTRNTFISQENVFETIRNDFNEKYNKILSSELLSKYEEQEETEKEKTAEEQWKTKKVKSQTQKRKVEKRQAYAKEELTIQEKKPEINPNKPLLILPLITGKRKLNTKVNLK